MNKDYNDEVSINELVDKYVESGLDEHKLDLMRAFDPYFKKYVHILCSNKTVDINNKDTITFLRLFMTDEERASTSSIAYAAKKTIQHLRMVFSDCTPDDIYDEMVCVFLEQLARYKPMIADHTTHKNRISFTHFLQVNSRYRIKNEATRRGKDALHGIYNIEYNDEMVSSEPSQESFEGPTNLDHEWVSGKTTGEIFNQLDEYDRYLLYLKYEKDPSKPLSDYDLAKITGTCRMAIRRKMLKIKEKVKSLVEA